MDPITLLTVAGTGLSATKTGTDLVGKLRDAIKPEKIDKDEVRRLCSEIYDQLLDAKKALVDVEDGLRELRRDGEKFERYDLERLPSGSLVWKYVPVDDGDNTSPHRICTKCKSEGHLTPLHESTSSDELWCPRCKHGIRSQPFNPSTIRF